MDKLGADIKKKIYTYHAEGFSEPKQIKELCASNISKEMNKIQAQQIKKLTKDFIKNKKYKKFFFSLDRNPVEKPLLLGLDSKKKYIDIIYHFFVYDDWEGISLLEALLDSEVVTMNDINNVIDSFNKKELCNLWRKIFLEAHYQYRVEEEEKKENKRGK